MSHRIHTDLYRGPKNLADPGNGGIIRAKADLQICEMTLGSGSETRTLANPTKAGIRLVVRLKTDGGGTLVLTAAAGLNASLDTTAAFDNAGDFLSLISVSDGSGYRWEDSGLVTIGTAQTVTANKAFTGTVSVGGVPPFASAKCTISGPHTGDGADAFAAWFYCGEAGQEITTHANGIDCGNVLIFGALINQNHNVNIAAGLVILAPDFAAPTSKTTTHLASLYVQSEPSFLNVTPANGPYAIYAEQGVNRLAGGIITGSAVTLNSSAELQSDSTTKGWLPPRMTETQRDAISTPPAGLVIFNTTTNKLNVRGASAWEAITSA